MDGWMDGWMEESRSTATLTVIPACLFFSCGPFRCFCCGDKWIESHSEPSSDKCFLITVTGRRAEKQKLLVKKWFGYFHAWLKI